MAYQTVHKINNELKDIAFVDILLPYTEIFIKHLEKINISPILINKLHKTLLKELSLCAEVTLQTELENFKNSGESSYCNFIIRTSNLIITQYPVLNEILKRIVNNYLKFIKKIYSNFHKDQNSITSTFHLEKNKNIDIKDIETNLGDGHLGESTVLITLSDGTKLIYKPRNIETTKSYNLFIEWVNKRLNVDLKTIKCLSYKQYGWLEFIPYNAVASEEELQEYYYKAGILLAITLVLGTKDSHYENVIASGKNPVIIDHETIIQPILSNESLNTWENKNKTPFFSVLESMLINHPESTIGSEFTGYGIKGNIEAMDLTSRIINANTINSKRVAHIFSKKLIKQNIPQYNNNHIFANDYQESFIEGFSVAYDLFINFRDELLSPKSPIPSFQNQKIRYVWRPTFIYFRILQYMRRADFMSDFEAYEKKLFELMSKAYKKNNTKDFTFILDFEMKQLLNGDIPIFNLNSLEWHLGTNKSFKIFKYNCVENIKYRINLLSSYHKEQQIEHISKWLDLKQSA